MSDVSLVDGMMEAGEDGKHGDGEWEARGGGRVKGDRVRGRYVEVLPA